MDENLVRIILDESYEDQLTLPELVSVTKTYFQSKGIVAPIEVISLLTKQVEDLIDKDMIRLYKNRAEIGTKHSQKSIIRNVNNWIVSDVIDEFTIDLTDAGVEEWRRRVFPGQASQNE